MENLGQEEAFWGALRESTFDDKFTAEDSAFIGCLNRADDIGLDVQDVSVLILIEDYAYRKNK